MQVGSASAFNIPRNIYSTDNLSASAHSTGARLKILQASTKALESLRENMTTSAEAPKTRAARKLEEAKQQLEMLKSGGYPPEVVARLAAELAHKISAAAAEFASAVAASATSTASAANVDVAATDIGPGAATEAAAETSASTSADDVEQRSPSGRARWRDRGTQRLSEDRRRRTAGIWRYLDRRSQDDGRVQGHPAGSPAADGQATRELRARTGQQASGAGAYPLEAQAGATARPTSITI